MHDQQTTEARTEMSSARRMPFVETEESEVLPVHFPMPPLPGFAPFPSLPAVPISRPFPFIKLTPKHLGSYKIDIYIHPARKYLQ